MNQHAFLPAHELAQRIRRKEVSALELLDHYLARIDRLNPAIRAVPVLDAERARQRAHEATRHGPKACRGARCTACR